MASTAVMPPPSTRPKAVKPPFWVSSCGPGFCVALLLERLKNHWFVALLGSLPNYAIAIVPRTLVLPGSLTTVANCGTLSIATGLPLTLKPPPCTTKLGIDRWMNVF